MRHSARHALRIGASVTALVITTVVTGCTGGPPATTPPASGEASGSPGSSATDGSATSTPTPVLPLDRATLAQHFADTARTLLTPGAAMLVRTADGTTITDTYGVTTLGGSTPVSLDDHIRIGSNTKTMTGTVILQLVQEGKIALDDPVSKYRPDVPNGASITINELLNMRSGLFNYTETYELNHDLDVDPQTVWNPEDLLKIGLALPPYFAPGEGFHYSNTNTLLLGLIAEQLDGKPFDEIMQTRIFTPLGLSNTSFPALADSSLPAPYANGYMFTDNVRTLATAALPADLLAQAEAGTLLPTDYTNSNPSWAWAAGSAISTIGDLATWVQSLVAGDQLNSDLQQRLESIMPAVASRPDAGYGWAISKVGAFYGHTGGLPGYNSFIGYDPVNRITVVVWTNLSPAADGRAPAATIAKRLNDDIFGTE